MNLRVIFKTTALYGLSTIVSRLIFFLLTPIYLGVFQPAQYGVVSDIYSLSAFLIVLLPLGLETAYFKFSQGKSDLSGTALLSILGFSGLFLLFVHLFENDLLAWKNYAPNTPYFRWMAYIVVLDALAIVPFASLRKHQKSLSFVILKQLNTFLNLGLILTFLFTPIVSFENKLDAVFLANLWASTITSVLVLIVSFSKLNWTLNWDATRKLWRFGFFIMLAGLLFMVNENLDKQLLSILLPENIALEQLGIYAACYKVSVFLTLIIQGIRLGLAPFMFDTNDSDSIFFQKYSRAVYLFILILCLGVVSITTGIHWIKELFIRNEAYWGGLQIIPILLSANLFLGVYSLFGVWYQRSNKPQIGVLISLVGAMITLVVNWFGIPKFGYMASAWATFFAYGIMMLTSFVWGQLKNPIPYPSLKVFGLLLLTTLLTFISYHIPQESFLVRYGILFVFSLILFALERHTFLRLIPKKSKA